MIVNKTDHLREVVRCLEDIAGRGHHASRVFEDWVGLMFWALQRNDEQYLRIMAGYDNGGPRGRREADLFAKAFGCLQAHMAVTGGEALGPLYEEFGADGIAGQYFTPRDVAAMMAEMLEPHGRILDPACGAGIMLVQSAGHVPEGKWEGAEFWGQDVALCCVMMCGLNLAFFNLPGGVIWGNSLAAEVRAAWRTVRTPVGGIIRPMEDVDGVRAALAATFARAKAPGAETGPEVSDCTVPPPCARPSLLDFMQ